MLKLCYEKTAFAKTQEYYYDFVEKRIYKCCLSSYYTDSKFKLEGIGTGVPLILVAILGILKKHVINITCPIIALNAILTIIFISVISILVKKSVLKKECYIMLMKKVNL